MTRSLGRAGAFTLVEVLIALTIVALGLGAAMRATIQLTSGAEALRMRTLALWVAENRLAERTSNRSRSDSASGVETQAGFQFAWRESVMPTADPAFRRIAIEVSAAVQPEHVLARLSGAVAAVEKTP